MNDAALQSLMEHECHRIANSRGLEVRCISGIVWVTQEGQLEDVVLMRGETWASKGAQPVVIGALEGRASFALAGSLPTGRDPMEASRRAAGYAPIEHHIRTHRLERTIAVAEVVAGLVVGTRDAIKSLGRLARGSRVKPRGLRHA